MVAGGHPATGCRTIYHGTAEYLKDPLVTAGGGGAANPDIARVDLAADARRRTRSCSQSTTNGLQHSRCGQGGSPEGWNFL